MQGSISMRDGVGKGMERLNDVIYTCRTELSEVCFGTLSARNTVYSLDVQQWTVLV